LTHNAELSGGFSVITAGDLLVMAEVPRVERLVPEARSTEESSGRPGTGQLGIPVARSAAGTSELSGEQPPSRRRWQVASPLQRFVKPPFD